MLPQNWKSSIHSYKRLHWGKIDLLFWVTMQTFTIWKILATHHWYFVYLLGFFGPRQKTGYFNWHCKKSTQLIKKKRSNFHFMPSGNELNGSLLLEDLFKYTSFLGRGFNMQWAKTLPAPCEEVCKQDKLQDFKYCHSQVLSWHEIWLPKNSVFTSTLVLPQRSSNDDLLLATVSSSSLIWPLLIEPTWLFMLIPSSFPNIFSGKSLRRADFCVVEQQHFIQRNLVTPKTRKMLVVTRVRLLYTAPLLLAFDATRSAFSADGRFTRLSCIFKFGNAEVKVHDHLKRCKTYLIIGLRKTVTIFGKT